MGNKENVIYYDKDSDQGLIKRVREILDKAQIQYTTCGACVDERGPNTLRFHYNGLSYLLPQELYLFETQNK